MADGSTLNNASQAMYNAPPPVNFGDVQGKKYNTCHNTLALQAFEKSKKTGLQYDMCSLCNLDKQLNFWEGKTHKFCNGCNSYCMLLDFNRDRRGVPYYFCKVCFVKCINDKRARTEAAKKAANTQPPPPVARMSDYKYVWTTDPTPTPTPHNNPQAWSRA